MAGVHALIGAGEGLITVGALAFLYSGAPRPDPRGRAAAGQPGRGRRPAHRAGLGGRLAAGRPPARRARVGRAELGFLDAARGPSYRLIPDYLVPGIPSEALATILAGVVGTLLVLGGPGGRAPARQAPHGPAGGRPRLRCARASGQACPMHVHVLDPYRPRSSPIHALDARVKLLLAVAFILTVALQPIGVWPAYLLLLALALSVAVLSDLGVGYVLRRAALALPFVLAAFPLVFTVAGPPLAVLPVGPWTLSVSGPGLARFASVAPAGFRQAAIVLAASTLFELGAMRQRSRGSRGLRRCGAISCYRRGPCLMRARDARSGLPAGVMSRARRPRTPPGRGRSAAWPGAQVAGGWRAPVPALFDAAASIYAAMAARGYDGEAR
jgi:energy-coupling factor transporter transmembrane protein EcfT